MAKMTSHIHTYLVCCLVSEAYGMKEQTCKASSLVPDSTKGSIAMRLRRSFYIVWKVGGKGQVYEL